MQLRVCHRMGLQAAQKSLWELLKVVAVTYAVAGMYTVVLHDLVKRMQVSTRTCPHSAHELPTPTVGLSAHTNWPMPEQGVSQSTILVRHNFEDSRPQLDAEAKEVERERERQFLKITNVPASLTGQGSASAGHLVQAGLPRLVGEVPAQGSQHATFSGACRGCR